MGSCSGGALVFAGRVLLAAEPVDREMERAEDPGVVFIHPSNRNNGFLAMIFFQSPSAVRGGRMLLRFSACGRDDAIHPQILGHLSVVIEAMSRSEGGQE